MLCGTLAHINCQQCLPYNKKFFSLNAQTNILYMLHGNQLNQIFTHSLHVPVTACSSNRNYTATVIIGMPLQNEQDWCSFNNAGMIHQTEIWNLYFMNYSNISSIMFTRFILCTSSSNSRKSFVIYAKDCIEML